MHNINRLETNYKYNVLAQPDTRVNKWTFVSVWGHINGVLL